MPHNAIDRWEWEGGAFAADAGDGEDPAREGVREHAAEPTVRTSPVELDDRQPPQGRRARPPRRRDA
jgi:hypothetical protein